ncbi:uncharacterized protein LOC136039940 [Artemia franciscana]|nr:hypothetical protein QYM36_008623 [Artemia franciscana]
MDLIVFCVTLLLPMSTVVGTNLEPGMLFKNSKNSRAVFVPLLPTRPCRIYGSRFYIQRLSSVTQTFDISDESINGQIASCQLRNSISITSPAPPRERMEFIYPGTKWCGPGDIANSPDDLGIYRKTDMCCREHDHCNDMMASGECKHGLCNSSPFTRAHCACDEKFRVCLMNNGDKVSDSVGVAFFNVGGVVCFKEEFPFTGVNRQCLTSTGRRKKRCVTQFGVPTHRFVQPEKYRSIDKAISSRSLAPMDAASTIDRVRSFVSDVSTVVKSVAQSSLHMYSLNKARAL